MRLLSVCVLLLLANGCLAAEDCKVDEDDNCQCTASDGLTLNIRGYFEYPVKVKQDKDYTYTYSPCSKLLCEPDQGARSRVCQRGSGDVIHNCGSNIKSWIIISRDPMEFVITYDGGTGSRESIVTFQYKKSHNSIEVVRSGAGRYYFLVTGEGVAPYNATTSPHTGGGREEAHFTVIEAIIVAIAGFFLFVVLPAIFVLICIYVAYKRTAGSAKRRPLITISTPYTYPHPTGGYAPLPQNPPPYSDEQGPSAPGLDIHK